MLKPDNDPAVNSPSARHRHFMNAYHLEADHLGHPDHLDHLDHPDHLDYLDHQINLTNLTN